MSRLSWSDRCCYIVGHSMELKLMMMKTMKLPSMTSSCTSTCERTNGSSDSRRSNRISWCIQCISTWMFEHRRDFRIYCCCQHHSWLLNGACLQAANRNKEEMWCISQFPCTQTIQRTLQLDSNHYTLLPLCLDGFKLRTVYTIVRTVVYIQ